MPVQEQKRGSGIANPIRNLGSRLWRCGQHHVLFSSSGFWNAHVKLVMCLI